MQHKLLLVLGFVLTLLNARAQTMTWQGVNNNNPTGGGSPAPFTNVLTSVTDASGNIIVLGSFFGDVAFGNTTLSTSYNSTSYIAKWNPTTSTWMWALSGGGNNAGFARVAVSGNNVYVGGTFTNSVTIAGTTLTGAGFNNVFLAKFTDNGTSLTGNWAKGSQGLADTGQGLNDASTFGVSGVVVSGSNVYLGGYFRNQATIAGVTLRTSTVYNDDYFVAKYVDNGATATDGWAIRSGGDQSDNPSAMAVSGNSIYLTGSFIITTTHGGSTFTSTGNSDSQLILVKYTDNGTSASVGWALSDGGSGSDAASAIVVNGGSVYLGGSFSSGSSIGGTTLNTTSTGGSGIFVAKYTDNGSTVTRRWGIGSTAGTGTSAVRNIAVSGTGIYATGLYSQGLTVAGTALTPTPGSTSAEIYVAKFTDNTTSAAGDGALTAGSVGIDVGIGVHPIGSTLYVTGYGKNGATFGSAGSISTTTTGNATFIARAGIPSSNSAPTDIQLSSASIAENAGANAAVGTFSTTDPNAGNTFTYSLVSGTGSTDNAAFNISGNTLRLTASADYETKNSYSIRVRVTDQGGLFYEEAFTISITNVNESPTDLALSSTTIAENQAPNTTVGTFSTTDPDAGNTFTYSLVSGTGSTDNASFNLSGNALRTSAAFDYETKSSYSIRVRTTDQGGLSYEESFTIAVTDVNENVTVTDINAAANSVSENAATGTGVGIQAAATLANATAAYALTDNAGGRFAINPTTGVVTVADGSLLNYEAATAHTITVRATFSLNAGFYGTYAGTQTFTIQVTNQPNATYLSSTAEQDTRGVTAGSTAQVVLRIPVVMDANTDEPLSLTQLLLTQSGTTANANIAGVRLYYTGNSNRFAATTLVSSSLQPLTSQVSSLTLTGPQPLTTGTNYFWLAYDVAAAAPAGNQLDATVVSMVIGGVTRTPGVTAPAGSRPVVVLGKRPGTALRLDGANAGYVDFGVDAPVLGTQYTQEIWVKPAVASGNILNGVLGYDPGSQSQRSPFIAISENNQVQIGFGTGVSLVSLTAANNTVTQGQWNHVVATYDGAELRLYVNGDLVTSTPTTATPTLTPVRFVGRLSNGGSTSFKGDIDEVAQWTRALTQSEIRLRRHLVLAGSDNSLASYVQFNEAAGNFADLIDGVGAPLTGTGAARTGSTAPVGYGTASLQAVPSTGTYSFAGTNAAINFTSLNGAAEVVVARLDGLPQGSQPSATGLRNVFTPAYWVINKYGGSSFAANVTYTLSPTDISAADQTTPANLKLFKRSSNSDGTFDTPIAATSANAAAGTVVFPVSSFSQTVIGTFGTSPLPVELVSFTAERVGQDGLLRWTTAQEKNNAYFAVESSVDGRTFRPAGRVNGHGTSTSSHSYQLTDANLARYEAPVVYYRLRQVDADGSEQLSAVRTITNAGPATKLAVYPSPARRYVEVLGASAGAPLSLYDATGRRLLLRTASAAGVAHVELPVGLPAGVYVLRAGNQAIRLLVE